MRPWLLLLAVMLGIIVAVTFPRKKQVTLMAGPAQGTNVVNVTNFYVTMPAEFGPDGYGFRHLSKKDSELVRECMNRMDNPWERSTLLEDLTVIKTVTHERMTANEIAAILSTQQNVATVSLALGAKRSIFSLDTLAYPQYESEYRLTKAQWKSLQDYCRLKLLDPIATDGVIKHWQSITNGTVPFGLQVRD